MHQGPKLLFSGCSLMFSTLFHSPRWLSELQLLCPHSRQRDGGRKRREEQKGEPQRSILLFGGFPSNTFSYISPARILSLSHTFTAHFLSPIKGRNGEDGPTARCTSRANPQPVRTFLSTSTSRLSPLLEKITEPC